MVQRRLVSYGVCLCAVIALGQAPAWGARPSIRGVHLEVDRAPQAQALPTATVSQIKRWSRSARARPWP